MYCGWYIRSITNDNRMYCNWYVRSTTYDIWGEPGRLSGLLSQPGTEHFGFPPSAPVIKSPGMSSRVCPTGGIKDPVPLIEKRRGGCPPSFIHQVIIVTGLNKLRLYVLALKMACRLGVKSGIHWHLFPRSDPTSWCLLCRIGVTWVVCPHLRLRHS